MKRALLALALLLCASSALAQTTATGTTTGQTPSIVAPALRRIKFSGNAGTAYCNPNGACPVLNSVAANASSAARTFLLFVGGYSVLKLQLNYTYSSGSAEVLSCSESLDGGATFGNVTSTAIAAGAGTVSSYSDNLAVSANVNITLGYDVRTDDWVKCTWSATGGGSSDKVTVFATAAVGQ